MELTADVATAIENAKNERNTEMDKLADAFVKTHVLMLSYADDHLPDKIKAPAFMRDGVNKIF